jgi:hypothetical protein
VTVEGGQLRTWGKKYFQLTPPSDGFEYFLVLWDNGDGKWTVRFRGGKVEEMREGSIEELTVPMDASPSSSIP